MSRLLKFIWLAAGLSLVLPFARDAVFADPRPDRFGPAVGAWTPDRATTGGYYVYLDRSTLPRGLRTSGSWQGGDDWEGEKASNWLPVGAPIMRVMVVGYPRHQGVTLSAEFRAPDNAPLPAASCDIADPGSTWMPWDVRVPPGAAEVRLVVQDRAADQFGWAAFSEPFARPSPMPREWFMAAQVFAAVALALTLVWGPGLLWVPRRLSDEARLAGLLGAGPFLLVAGGLAVWVLAGAIAPARLALALVVCLWGAIGVTLWKRTPHIAPVLGRVLAMSALIVIAATAKATFAGGPEGELYGGTVSRTLLVGDRSDARISYHVVQVAAHHYGPTDPRAEMYFAPWTYFTRGPLAGLAAIPVTLATGGVPPASKPDQPWMPFDVEGFAAYRILLMTLASGVIVALFAAVARFAGEEWGFIAAGWFVLSPFGVHDILFTWPKFAAAAWVTVAFLFAHKERALLAGLALGVGFLFHPLALLWTPWLALWIAGRTRPRGLAQIVRGVIPFGAGLAALVIPWMGLGAVAPHSEIAPYGQSAFFNYLVMADGGPATRWTWLMSRWMNFSNTFLPFWLFIFHPDSRWVSSIGTQSGPLVRFAFGWWNTLPLGLGLVAFGVSLVALARASRTRLAAVVLLVAGPSLLLIGYWGSYAAGLMRECGHPLFVAWIGLTCVTLARVPGRLAAVVRHPAFTWIRLPELLLMLWLTTLMNPGGARRPLDPLYFSVNVAAVLVCAWLVARTARPRLIGA